MARLVVLVIAAALKRKFSARGGKPATDWAEKEAAMARAKAERQAAARASFVAPQLRKTRRAPLGTLADTNRASVVGELD